MTCRIEEGSRRSVVPPQPRCCGFVEVITDSNLNLSHGNNTIRAYIITSKTHQTLVDSEKLVNTFSTTRLGSVILFSGLVKLQKKLQLIQNILQNIEYITPSTMETVFRLTEFVQYKYIQYTNTIHNIQTYSRQQLSMS